MQHINIFIRLSNVSYKLLFITVLLLFSTSYSLAFDRAAFDQKTIDQEASGNKTIVVTLKPLYSLVAHLSEGIETPVLLIKQTPSSHHYNMRPSERMALANADVIIWFGPQMETYLTKTIQQIKNSAAEKTLVISAMQAEHLKLLNRRTKQSQEDHHRNTSDKTNDRTDKIITDKPNQQNIDPHIWLSTYNTMAISKHITALLISADPKNTALYNKNLRQLLNKIKQTKAFIQTTLNSHSVHGQTALNQTPSNLTTLSRAPFIAYHDAFQYFENENQLNYIDAISYNEETGPGLKHIRQIKSQIEKNNIQCLVYQQPKPAIVDSLTIQTGIKATDLDPLGRSVSNNKSAWFELMQQLARDFKLCLQE